MSTAMTGSPESKRLRLVDGRVLSYLEVGKNDGWPVIYCHGQPSSRLEVQLVAEQAAVLGIRVVGVDRPGIGYSDPKPNARLLDWPDDIAELANHLGMQRFAVVGFSGGGPFALACAAKIPQRVTTCGVISSVPPTHFIRQAGPPAMRRAYGLLQRFPPWLFRALVRRTMHKGARSDAAATEQALLRNGTRLGPADQQVVSLPAIRHLYAQSVVESYRQGVQANVEAALLLTRDWGFRVEDLTVAPLWLWHGEQDRLMPVVVARLLAQVMPQCHATVYSDSGHLSTLVHHAHEILTSLHRSASSGGE